jgi:hypothetical protein
MVCFGPSRRRLDTASGARPAAARLADESRPALPAPGDALFEIGVVLALHLAFATAVVLTLDAFGVG